MDLFGGNYEKNYFFDINCGRYYTATDTFESISSGIITAAVNVKKIVFFIIPSKKIQDSTLSIAYYESISCFLRFLVAFFKSKIREGLDRPGPRTQDTNRKPRQKEA